MLLLLLGCLLTGCSRLQLPAIDPNGSRIFLPLPNTTQLDVPRLHSRNGRHGIIPQSAFTRPATPPPCVDAGGVYNLYGDKHHLFRKLQEHFETGGEAGEMQVTPRLVVAPVGGEVVLLAGICGQDGYLVKREPIEWMLSPDSVGTFIEVGDDRSGRLTNFLLNSPKVEKLDVDFARGRTSSKETLITRGSAQHEDDIRLKEGQTWLSISSPSEGVSRITVLAPDSEIWDRRRLTSTIYWVDAQWEFPSPLIRRVGEPAQLVTRVTQAENLVPAEGWFVDYTILDPSVATFGNGAAVAGEPNKQRVRVDSNGQAVVNIVAAQDGRGTTPVIVDVIRPAQPSDRLPELVLGRGQTTVSFSAPGLELAAGGPPVGSIGEQLTYWTALGNSGDLNAEDVQLRFNIPAGMRFLGSTYQPSAQTDSVLIWEQGVLRAGEQLDVSVTLEPLREGDYNASFEAAATGFPVRRQDIVTRVVAPSIDVRFEPRGGVAQAEAGQTVEYEIDVKNTGRQTLAEMKLLIEADPGLAVEVQGPTGLRYESSVERTISRLAPGETVPIGVRFQVQQQGQHQARLKVQSGSELLAERSTSIAGVAPRPKVPRLEVSLLEFPETFTVVPGKDQIGTIRVANTGETKLSDIRVIVRCDESLTIASVKDGRKLAALEIDDSQRVLTWNAPDMLQPTPGVGGSTVQDITLGFRPQSATAAGRITVEVIAAGNVQASTSQEYRSTASVVPPSSGTVLPPGGQPGAGNVLPPAGEGDRSNTLKLYLQDFGDPVALNESFRYSLVLVNDRNRTDRNVKILLKKPEGVRLVSVTRFSDGAPVSVDFRSDQLIEFPTVQTMRAGEELRYIIEFVPTLPILLTFEAQAMSELNPPQNAVSASETTQVIRE